MRSGCAHVVLSDQRQGPERAPIPMILAVGAVHTHLVRHSLRTFTSLNVRAAECLDVHYVAVLIGAGATTVNAYLAQESIADRHRRGLFGDLTLRECVARYKKAVDKGLLKVMSKMGISVLSSYRGGMNFEAIGLSRALVNEFFPGVPSRISGIGLSGIARRVLALHSRAWDEDAVHLPVGGLYKLRRARREPRLRRRADPHPPARGGRPTATPPSSATPRRCAACRRWRCATCSTSAPRAGRRCRSRRSRASPRSGSAFSRPASRSARSRPRRTRRSPSP